MRLICIALTTHLDKHDFPILFRAVHADREKRVLNAFEILSNAALDNQIFNADYKLVKDVINVTIRDAWDHIYPTIVDWRSVMSDPANPDPSDALKSKQYLMLDVPLGSLAEIKSGKNKVAKIKGFDSTKKQMNAFIDEVWPLVDIIEYFKDKVVMGRKPTGKPPKEVNPNKVVKTCPCCFRPVAVEKGKMVSHGYRMHRNFGKSADCPASKRFPPYQTSLEGTKWLLQQRENQLELAKTVNEKFGISEDIKILKQMIAEWRPKCPSCSLI